MLVTTLIENAMTTNAAAGDSEPQAVAQLRLAQAIVDTIKLLQLNYTTGLVAPPGGGPVTGVLTGVIIS